MESNHKPNKKWRVYLILLAFLCAIILFIVQIKKSPKKTVANDVEIEVEIVQKDTLKVLELEDSVIYSTKEDIVPQSLQNSVNQKTSEKVVDNKLNKTTVKQDAPVAVYVETKKLAIKEINLKLIKSTNKPNSNYPFYNGGDEVLKGELYYLLKDNVVGQTVDKSIEIIDFWFTVTEDKNINEFGFKTDVSREIQKKIIKELGNLNDWNTQNFKGNITYSVQLILL